VTALRGNLRALGLEDRATVIAGDAVVAARQAPPAPWQLVFVDTPYRSDLAVRAVPRWRPTPDRDAVIVIEHDRHNVHPDALGSLYERTSAVTAIR